MLSRAGVGLAALTVRRQLAGPCGLRSLPSLGRPIRHCRCGGDARSRSTDLRPLSPSQMNSRPVPAVPAGLAAQHPLSDPRGLCTQGPAASMNRVHNAVLTTATLDIAARSNATQSASDAPLSLFGRHLQSYRSKSRREILPSAASLGTVLTLSPRNLAAAARSTIASGRRPADLNISSWRIAVAASAPSLSATWPHHRNNGKCIGV